jgi:hypothetical protein
MAGWGWRVGTVTAQATSAKVGHQTLPPGPSASSTAQVLQPGLGHKNAAARAVCIVDGTAATIVGVGHQNAAARAVCIVDGTGVTIAGVGHSGLGLEGRDRDGAGGERKGQRNGKDALVHGDLLWFGQQPEPLQLLGHAAAVSAAVSLDAALCRGRKDTKVPEMIC